MKKILNKQLLKYLVISVLIVLVSIFAIGIFAGSSAQTPKTSTTDLRAVSEQILATGSVAPQTQAVLNFQLGGKLTYLPFKEGDKISQGQTIASIDSYALQKELQISANSYQSAKNSANQTSENQQAGVLEGQERVTLDSTSKNSYAISEDSVIYDAVRRIVDNANLAQNSAQIGVDLANYSLSLASLTSPINGVVLHEDINTAGVNVTPVTSFVVADPDSMVFSANVRQQDVSFISVGNFASVLLDGSNQYVNGVVDRIYPQKTTLANGDDVYRVDIKIDSLPKDAKFGQGGTALIKSNFNQQVILVPSWAVLSDKYIWVISDGKPVLKTIQTGDTVNGQTEVLSGLSESDKVITNPQAVISKRYQIL